MAGFMFRATPPAPAPKRPLAEPDTAAPDEKRPRPGAPPAVPPSGRGVGGTIVSCFNPADVWGVVTGEEETCWRLASGRIAKKATEGERWTWKAVPKVPAPQLIAMQQALQEAQQPASDAAAKSAPVMAAPASVTAALAAAWAKMPGGALQLAIHSDVLRPAWAPASRRRQQGLALTICCSAASVAALAAKVRFLGRHVGLVGAVPSKLVPGTVLKPAPKRGAKPSPAALLTRHAPATCKQPAVRPSDGIVVGQRVRVRPGASPRWGWGAVQPADCGAVSWIEGPVVRVAFPAQGDWAALDTELEVAVDAPKVVIVRATGAPRCCGELLLQPEMRENGQPVWRAEPAPEEEEFEDEVGERWLYSTPGGRWTVCCGEPDFASEGPVVSAPHGGVMPQDASGWGLTGLPGTTARVTARGGQQQLQPQQWEALLAKCGAPPEDPAAQRRLEVRDGLKAWKHEFREKHGKEPTTADVKADKTQRELYAEFAAFKEDPLSAVTSNDDARLNARVRDAINEIVPAQRASTGGPVSAKSLRLQLEQRLGLPKDALQNRKRLIKAWADKACTQAPDSATSKGPPPAPPAPRRPSPSELGPESLKAAVMAVAPDYAGEFAKTHPPGSPTMMEAFADRLGVAPETLKEAMRRWKEEGRLELSEFQGWVRDAAVEERKRRDAALAAIAAEPLAPSGNCKSAAGPGTTPVLEVPDNPAACVLTPPPAAEPPQLLLFRKSAPTAPAADGGGQPKGAKTAPKRGGDPGRITAAELRTAVFEVAPRAALGPHLHPDQRRVQALYASTGGLPPWTHARAARCGECCTIEEEDARDATAKLRFKDGFHSWYPKAAVEGLSGGLMGALARQLKIPEEGLLDAMRRLAQEGAIDRDSVQGWMSEATRLAERRKRMQADGQTESNPFLEPPTDEAPPAQSSAEEDPCGGGAENCTTAPPEAVNRADQLQGESAELRTQLRDALQGQLAAWKRRFKEQNQRDPTTRELSSDPKYGPLYREWKSLGGGAKRK
eukprot:TRINITY_DN4378_c2_g1_i1.p1 TRINITY_DN4378_c2_g1~~TRINITY_DN4378_c2_g1_i1.p1  ORF type:complete len:1010 (+),score=317.68 TRINITY_DN4378_c2_g1_i1:107-3136(+)